MEQFLLNVAVAIGSACMAAGCSFLIYYGKTKYMIESHDKLIEALTTGVDRLAIKNAEYASHTDDIKELQRDVRALAVQVGELTGIIKTSLETLHADFNLFKEGVYRNRPTRK